MVDTPYMITYHSSQKPVDIRELPDYRFKATGGEYRPTWLVETADWKVVSGKEAVNGYCTLSYAWEQSGQVVRQSDGEYTCNDVPLHSIIMNDGTRQEPVKYDTLLKQLCKDFQIDYLWYDKACIDQGNKATKLQEIKQMHMIYSNARYTIALVPEIAVSDPSDFEKHSLYGSTRASLQAKKQTLQSKWWKRSWTLEELMMSRRILLVGSNAHVWRHAMTSNNVQLFPDFISFSMLGFNDKDIRSANQVLRYAHFRTSSKQHDKIFALLNIFDGIISMDVDYQSDIVDTIKSFYRQLVHKDFTVMCFGNQLGQLGEVPLQNEMIKHSPPSWIGVYGKHTPSETKVHGIYYGYEATTYHPYHYWTDDKMCLHMRAKYYTIAPHKCVNDNDSMFYDKERVEGFQKAAIVDPAESVGGGNKNIQDWARWHMMTDAGCIATHYWNTDSPSFRPVLPLSLTEECDECIVVSVLFNTRRVLFIEGSDNISIRHYHTYSFPILKHCAFDDTYKAVGILLFNYSDHRSDPEDPNVILDRAFGSCQNSKLFTIK